MAEFFRRNPELLGLQGDLNIRLVQIDLTVDAECLDVRDRAKAEAAGIGIDRLRSSDQDEDVRYAECRLLAFEVEAADGTGIAYPSAGYRKPGWNLVTFGEPNGAWRSRAHMDVSIPVMNSADIEPI